MPNSEVPMLLLLLACRITAADVDAALDPDGDGFGPEEDCAAMDGAVSPGAGEVWYDGIDQDCSGGSDYDQDGDGFASSTVPNKDGVLGEDCDDLNEEVNPGAEEIWYDSADQNCDGDDDFDQDGDGFNDFDQDGDGFWSADEEQPDGTVGSDCDDSNKAINPDAEDAWYDGVDQNCDGADDFDQDRDGFQSANNERTDGSVGDDCDDTNNAVSPGAAEVCNSGLDEDCSGDDNDCSIFGDVLIAEADFVYTGGAGSWAGGALASGDWNDDGLMDLAIGAPLATNMSAQSNAGRVHLVYGSLPAAMTFNLEEDAVFEGVNASDFLGKDVGSGGDLDGDGVADLLMNAKGYDDDSLTDNGAVILIYGGPTWSGTIPITSADARIYGDGGADELGWAAHIIGDVDGDGFDELAMGAYRADYEGGDSGAVYIIPGSATRYSGGMAAGSVAGVVLAGDGSTQLGGYGSLGEAFDLNGDSLADIVISDSKKALYSKDNGGAVFLTYGDPSVLHAGVVSASGTADTWIRPAATHEELGARLGSPGDVDGDGYHDLLLCASGYDDPAGSVSGTGGVFLISGSSTRLSGIVTVTTVATATVTGVATNDFLTPHLSGGDLNSDGFADLVLGSHNYDHDGVPSTGGAFVFFGPVSGAQLATDADALLVGPEDSAQMGLGLTMFDANGDGLLDVFIGAFGSDTVYGYLGGGL